MPFSTEVECSIQAACARLDFLPRRPELATEHLLLGLAADDHEVAVWLRQRGLNPDAIEAEIRRLHGYVLPETPESEEEESMYEQFTDRARKIMQLANQEAQRFNHEYIGTEHILLGLVREGNGVGAHVLKNRDVDLRKIRLEVEKLVQSGPDNITAGKLPQTPRAKKVIEYSMEEARNLNHTYVGTEHILLGLLREQEGVAARMLLDLGLNLQDVRAEVLRVFGEGMEDPKGFQQRTGVPIAPITPSSPLGGPVAELPETSVLRILDAAGNRAREGLRVVEDFVRFVLDDRHLTELCKQLRHDLTAALSQIATDSRMAARETQEDVGTVLTTPSEQRRDNVASVVRANFARLQESLRSLEEFGKLANAGLSESFKQLRYRVYTLERAVDITSGSIEVLAAAKLYVLFDGRGSPEEFERLVVSLIDAGVQAIQLRDKQLTDRELLARARLLRALTWETPTLCIINDRPDLAALAGADGVHVGQEEISVKDARRIVGTAALVGVSTHSIEQARQAVLDGANYIGVGPTFPSATKQFEQFPGVELLRTVAAEIRLPAFAIGGINRENLGEVLAAGFTRIAVSGAVTAADDPRQAAKELLEELQKHHGDTEGTEQRC
jgi:thiamine-phosphate pyrophosphorylase